jgi:predicted peptidase
MKIIFYFIVAIGYMNNSCSKDNDSVSETFNDTLRPFFQYNETKDQYLLKPWNYSTPQNANRKYPLVIYLHGSGGAGNISYLNYIGYDNPDDVNTDETALNFQKSHPCFVLVPQTSSSWDNNSLIQQVEEIKSANRIDESRIYLIGYSMGGSGSYSFANAYYDYNSHLFAGIIRLAGQSQTIVRDAIADKTAIWLHIGLEDTEQRVQVTREAYNFLKNYYENAVETTSALTIPGYEGTTYTLTINSNDKFKRTEYEGVGHGVSIFPFKDPYLILWLFKQHL